MKLSENLKRIRKDNNLSQEQLAEKLGVSRQAVSKWESGQSYPEMDKVLLICKLFNYNLDELMNENIKEVDETKQSKININKYVEDFFNFITKTIDMLSVMKFRQKIKCLIEQFFIGIILFVVFMIFGAIGSSILSGLLGGLYYAIHRFCVSLYIVFSLVAGITIMLHIFKTRYLDYYEIVKEENEKENQIENDTNKVDEEERYDEKRKVFIEKKKEKIIIRDPNHSQSKFLNGLFRIMLSIIKFSAICVAACFAFTFVALFCLLVLSFVFVKTGLVFWGALFAIISGLIVNFIILELFYNFIINKKSKKTRMAISFVIALILAGISIGMILIGITEFNIVEDNSSSFTMKEVYEYDMTENLSLDFYKCAYKFIETDSDKVKIIVKHTEFSEVGIYNEHDVIGIYCNSDSEKIIDLIKTIIKDLNNKELRDYPGCAEVTICASKDNIETLIQNEIKKYELSIENELAEAYEENAELESKIIELEDKIVDKDNKIEELEMQIQDLKVEMEFNGALEIE